MVLESEHGFINDSTNLGAQKLPMANDPLQKLKSSTAETYKQITDVDEVPRKLSKHIWVTRETFFPNWYFRWFIFMSAFVIVCIACVSFTLYFEFFYTNDRTESLMRWEKQLNDSGIHLDEYGIPLEIQTTDSKDHQMDICPDLILQFAHPNFERLDDAIKVNREVGQRLMTDHSATPIAMAQGSMKHRRAKRQMSLSNVGESVLHADPDGGEGFISATSKKLFSIFTCLGRQHSEGDEANDAEACGKATRTTTMHEHTTLSELRVALLQDIYKLLPTLGFNVRVFSSIDWDEIFVCVSLESHSAMSHYLLRDNYKLQVNYEIVRKLDIEQPSEEPASSPPFIQYDPFTVEQLHHAGILETNDDQELYRVFHNIGGRECIMSSADRIHCIFKELSYHVNIEAAVNEGIVLNCYAVHSTQRIAELKATWANWRMLFDSSFVQPIQLINTYYGPRIAFIFAWAGLYCKALLPLVFLGLCWEIAVLISKKLLWAQLDLHMIIGFSVALIIWARVASNIWDREQSFYQTCWNINSNIVDKVVLASFDGTRERSPVDYNMTEKMYPGHMYELRKFVANFVTLIFCIFVMVLIELWMVAFEGHMNIISSLCLSMMIKVFELIFKQLVVVLTSFENHKYQDDHYNSYLWKYFALQFVNNYSAFFFISLAQRNTISGCKDGDCFYQLRRALTIALIVLSACSIAQVMLFAVLKEINLGLETIMYRWTHEKEAAPRGLCEEQAKWSDFQIREQIDMMLPLVISLGHMLLFGAVAGIILPLCLIVFMVQIRGSAVILTSAAKRPFPVASKGIGAWRSIMQILMAAGVFYSGLLFTIYGETFRGAPVLAKFSGFLVYCLAMLLTTCMVDVVCPPADSTSHLLSDRRVHVQQKLQRCASQSEVSKGRQDMKEEEIAAKYATFYDEMENRQWKTIPRFCDTEKLKVDKLRRDSIVMGLPTPPITPGTEGDARDDL